MENKPYKLKLLEHYSFVLNKTGLILHFTIGSNTFSKQFEEDYV